MTQRHSPVERAVELFVFAPLGIGAYLRDVGPSFVKTVVARGRAEFDRRHEQVSQHLTTARSTGEVALAFGVPKLRERFDAMLTRDGHQPAPASASASVVVPRPRPQPTVIIPPDDAPSSDELPIPGYDALSASQVVERLTGLARAELDAVHDYEATHRQRRTILGKIEQLAG